MRVFFINRAGNVREVTMFSASSSPSSSMQYELPVPIEKSSMTFEVVEGAFKRGQQKLFDSRG